jgi:acetoacetyl-CoA synthetase
LEPLWRPHRDQITNSSLTRFQLWLHEERGLDLNDHGSLYDWSVRDLDGFWGAIADFFGVRFHTAAERVLHRDTDPLQTRWFPGGTVNYAEHMLRFGQNEVPVSDDRLAVLYCAEPGEFDNRQVLTRKELIEQVTQLASAFSSFGVRCGDRVAGYLPNRIETLVAFLATASLGAIWSNCPPELSSRGVLERLTQIEPKILLSVFGYRYAGKTHDRTTALAEIAAGLPTLRQVIVIPPIPDEKVPDFGGTISVQRWSDLVGPGQSAATLCFRAVPFVHPLYPVPPERRVAEADCARAWWYSPGAPQGVIPAFGSPARRQVLLVHDGWLDDVELSGLWPCARSQRGPLRRKSEISRFEGPLEID